MRVRDRERERGKRGKKTEMFNCDIASKWLGSVVEREREGEGGEGE